MKATTSKMMVFAGYDEKRRQPVEYALQWYAATINALCVPLLKDLGLFSNDVRQVLGYCTKGAVARMKRDFLTVYPESGAIREDAEATFAAAFCLHREYCPAANASKFNKFLYINNGLVLPDPAKLQEATARYKHKQI